MESLHVLTLSVVVLAPRCALHTFSGEKCVFLSRTQTQENFLSSVWLAGASVVYLVHKAGHPIAGSFKLDGPNL